MKLSIITNNILKNIKRELEKEENQIILKKNIIKPIIKNTIDELFPYFIKMIIIILGVIFCIVVSIFMNIRIWLK